MPNPISGSPISTTTGGPAPLSTADLRAEGISSSAFDRFLKTPDSPESDQSLLPEWLLNSSFAIDSEIYLKAGEHPGVKIYPDTKLTVHIEIEEGHPTLTLSSSKPIRLIDAALDCFDLEMDQFEITSQGKVLIRPTNWLSFFLPKNFDVTEIITEKFLGRKEKFLPWSVAEILQKIPKTDSTESVEGPSLTEIVDFDRTTANFSSKKLLLPGGVSLSNIRAEQVKLRPTEKGVEVSASQLTTSQLEVTPENDSPLLPRTKIENLAVKDLDLKFATDTILSNPIDQMSGKLSWTKLSVGNEIKTPQTDLEMSYVFIGVSGTLNLSFANLKIDKTETGSAGLSSGNIEITHNPFGVFYTVRGMPYATAEWTLSTHTHLTLKEMGCEYSEYQGGGEVDQVHLRSCKLSGNYRYFTPLQRQKVETEDLWIEDLILEKRKDGPWVLKVSQSDFYFFVSEEDRLRKFTQRIGLRGTLQLEAQGNEQGFEVYVPEFVASLNGHISKNKKNFFWSGKINEHQVHLVKNESATVMDAQTTDRILLNGNFFQAGSKTDLNSAILKIKKIEISNDFKKIRVWGHFEINGNLTPNEWFEIFSGEDNQILFLREDGTNLPFRARCSNKNLGMIQIKPSFYTDHLECTVEAQP